MADNNVKPVALDETLQSLVQALLSQNAGQREMRDVLTAQNQILSGVLTAIDTGNALPILVFSVTYNGSAYALDGVTVESIESAINSGVTPVMKIVYENNAYFIALSKKAYHPSTGALVGYQFNSDKNCPAGSFGSFSIMKANGKVNWSAAAEPSDDSRSIAVKVGAGVEDVEAAIAENLTKMLERECERWKFAQSLAENFKPQ